MCFNLLDICAPYKLLSKGLKEKEDPWLTNDIVTSIKTKSRPIICLLER